MNSAVVNSEASVVTSVAASATVKSSVKFWNCSVVKTVVSDDGVVS